MQMDTFLDLDIYFPEGSESRLVAAMEQRVSRPWQWQPRPRPSSSPADSRFVEFCVRKDKDDALPSSTLYFDRKEPAHLRVETVDANFSGPIPDDFRNQILRQFDSEIAGPAAGDVGGRTRITERDESELRLSPEADQRLSEWAGCSTWHTGHHDDEGRFFQFVRALCECNPDGIAEPELRERILDRVMVRGDWDEHAANEYITQQRYAERARETIAYHRANGD